MAANVLPIVLLGAAGVGAYLLTRKKEEKEPAERPATPEDLPTTQPGVPPSQAVIDAAANAGDLLGGAALTACPDRADLINAAMSQFALNVVNSPREALETLRANVTNICPEVSGVPGLTEPPGPTDLTGDPIVETDANGLAARIQSEAASGGCERLTPSLVRAFQAAHNVETPQGQIAEDGRYDFTTAAAVQLRLTAQGMGLAPAICEYPDLIPSDANVLLSQLEGFRSQFERLHSEVTQ